MDLQTRLDSITNVDLFRRACYDEYQKAIVLVDADPSQARCDYVQWIADAFQKRIRAPFDEYISARTDQFIANSEEEEYCPEADVAPPQDSLDEKHVGTCDTSPVYSALPAPTASSAPVERSLSTFSSCVRPGPVLRNPGGSMSVAKPAFNPERTPDPKSVVVIRPASDTVRALIACEERSLMPRRLSPSSISPTSPTYEPSAPEQKNSKSGQANPQRKPGRNHHRNTKRRLAARVAMKTVRSKPCTSKAPASSAGSKPMKTVAPVSPPVCESSIKSSNVVSTTTSAMPSAGLTALSLMKSTVMPPILLRQRACVPLHPSTNIPVSFPSPASIVSGSDLPVIAASATSSPPGTPASSGSSSSSSDDDHAFVPLVNDMPVGTRVRVRVDSRLQAVVPLPFHILDTSSYCMLPYAWYNPLSWFRPGERVTEIVADVGIANERYVVAQAYEEAKSLKGHFKEARVTTTAPYCSIFGPDTSTSNEIISATLVQNMAKFGDVIGTEVPSLDRYLNSTKSVAGLLTISTGAQEVESTVRGVVTKCIRNLSAVSTASAILARDMKTESLTRSRLVFGQAPVALPTSSMATVPGNSHWSRNLLSSLVNFVWNTPIVRIAVQCIVTLAVVWLLQHYLPLILAIPAVREMASDIASVVAF
jgi:hypothetical protein